jgi:hypothetical protein
MTFVFNEEAVAEWSLFFGRGLASCIYYTGRTASNNENNANALLLVPSLLYHTITNFCHLLIKYASHRRSSWVS